VQALTIANLSADFFAQLDLSRYWFVTGSFGLVIRKDPVTCRQPDIAVYEKSSGVLADGYFHSAPQLVIEVISPSKTRKMKEGKIRDYESIGVPEIWLLCPNGWSAEVLVLENGQLRRSALQVNGLLRPRGLPGVEIDISRIWPD